MEAVTKPESLIKSAMMLKRNCDAHEKHYDPIASCRGCPFFGQLTTADGKSQYKGCKIADLAPFEWNFFEEVK